MWLVGSMGSRRDRLRRHRSVSSGPPVAVRTAVRSSLVKVTVEEYAGSHRDLAWSFREAEDSERLLDSYIDLGRLWVARTPDGEAVGHLQAVPREPDLWEVTNTAVAEPSRGPGVGPAPPQRAPRGGRSAGVAPGVPAAPAPGAR